LSPRDGSVPPPLSFSQHLNILRGLIKIVSRVSFAESAESYITKEAARELRSKLSVREELRDQDYDDILRRIIMSVHQPSDDNAERNVYEKKYFDYLPNDLDSEDVTAEETNVEQSKPRDDISSVKHDAASGRRVNSRKFKRDVDAASRQKRQGFIVYPVPLVQYSHYTPSHFLDFYFPDQMPGASSIVSRFDAPPQPFIPFPSTFKSPGYHYPPPPANNNPFHPSNNAKPFHPPGNAYLPPSRPGKK
jgi:hypothetical protein